MSDALENFRKTIDGLDAQIIALLKDRMHVVKQVGDLKRSTAGGVCPIRAGREATMLKRIAESCRGSDFSPLAAAQLWRIIIGTSTALEADLNIAVFAPRDQRDLFWLAREYFGPAANITTEPHIKRVIGNVADGAAAIGIVPTFSDDPWWQHLIQPHADAPKIFAHLPYVSNGEKLPTAFALAKLLPEASGDDRSLYVFEMDNDVSQHRLQTALKQCKLAATPLSTADNSPTTRQHLVEMQGFFLPESAECKMLAKELGSALQQLHFLGAYAAPFTIGT